MSSLAALVASYSINALWQIPLLTGTGWLVCRLVNRLGSLAQHRVWLVTLTASVLLPLCHLSGFLSWPGSLAPSNAFASVHTSVEQVIFVQKPGLLVMPAKVINAIACSYLVPFFFFLLRFATSIHSTRNLIDDALPLSLEIDFANAWENTKRVFDLSTVRILTSSAVMGPVTVSMRGPILLLPESFLGSTSARDFRVAVAHECAHIKRSDFSKNLLYEAMSLFIAFHPVTWLLKAQIAQTREMACDAMAVDAVGDSLLYVHALLRLANATVPFRPVMTFNAIGIFDANILEKRIMMLRAKKSITPMPARLGLVLAGGFCLTLTAISGARAAVGLAPPRLAAPINGGQVDKVYKIGKGVSAPKVIYAPDPEYPKNLALDGIVQGNCLISLVVDTTGSPRKVHVVHSLSDAFDKKAVEAVGQYRFTPGQREGVPVAVALVIEVNFQKF